jgi:putative DNA primase/helicase
MALIVRELDEEPEEPAGPKPAQLATMVAWLKLLYEGQPGLVNLRAFGVRRVTAGKSPNESQIYAPDEQGLTQLARRARELSPRAPAVYATLNPVLTTVGMGSARADLIACRRWLFGDFDPPRGHGERSADDGEKQECRVVARRAIRWLREEHGWPAPILADSGNGYHALWRIDLPNDPAAHQLVRDVLRALHHRFGDEEVCRIDSNVANADRLTKVYGTVARTGEHSEKYPHRVSAILEVPADLVVVDRGRIEAVAALAPSESRETGQPAAGVLLRSSVDLPGGRLVARESAPDPRRAYAQKAVAEEVLRVETAPSGDRNAQLYRSAAALHELAEAGALSWPDVERALTAAACRAGLDVDPNCGMEGIAATLRSARRKTAGKARDLSHVGNGEAKANGRASRSKDNDESRPDDPHRLARSFLEAHHHADGPTIRWWNDEWHVWRGRRWVPTSDRELAGRLAGHCRAELDRSGGGKVSRALVSNVALALQGLVQVDLADVPEQPAWLPPTGADDPDPGAILNTASGVVDLPALLAGSPAAVRPSTPRLFTPTALRYPYDPAAPSPRAWLDFLDTVWGDDPESIRALRQWFGYLLTSATDQQKILLVVGPRRSGKGTIVRVLRQLVGESNVAAPTLSALGTQFGLQPLIGKTLAAVPESRLTGRSDAQAIVERLLSISGEDPQSIDRKGISYWHGVLRTRFVLLGNELPRLSDYSGAMAGRLIVLRLTKSFQGREDRGLLGRLLAELPSILAWAVEGWRDLRSEGRLLQPQSGRELLEEFERLTNPVGAFLAEKCELGPDCRVPVKDLYDAWKTWCESVGRDHPGDAAGFCRQLYAACESITMQRQQLGGHRLRWLVGVRLAVGEDDIAF